MKFKKYIQVTYLIMLLLGVAMLGLAAAVWSKNVYTGILYIIIGLINFLNLLIAFSRIGGKKDEVTIGNISVQHSWLCISIGVAGAATILAPFFEVGSLLPYLAFIICIIWILIGIMDIYKAVVDVKARMIV
jgi:hypothetical protein